MNTQQLECFIHVADKLNFTKAAEELYLSTPTVTHHIKSLEEELGAQLFVRGKRLMLTDAGLMLRRRAEEVAELVDKIETEFAEPEEVGGRISIGEGAIRSSAILMKAMVRFREKYPKVQYDIYSNTSDYIKERLDKGLCDFGLLLEPIDIEKYDFIRLPVKERWGLFMERSHPLAEKEYIEREDVKSVPLITASRLSVQKEIANWLGGDTEQLNIFATCNIITNAQIMVEPGEICFMTVEGAMDSFQRENLVFRPLRPALELSSVLVWKKFQPFSRAAGRFLEEFRNMLDEYTGA